MEFIKANYLNTTTQIAVNNATSTISYLFNRDEYYQWITDGLNNDATTATITITFDETTAVSRIALIDTNIKSFTIFYNGSTSNTFSLSTDGSTNASSFSNNSQTSLYMRVASTTMVSSITIDLKTTQTANQEKLLGYILISDLYTTLTQIPSAEEYNPNIIPKQIVHKLSDGGTRIHRIRKKWAINFNLDYISTSQRDSLLDVYNLLDPFHFVPFGTTTSWDGICPEVIWDGPFEFYEYSTNAISSGFSGSVKLSETPI